MISRLIAFASLLAFAAVCAAPAAQLTLSWQDNSTNETGFVIERATGSDGAFAPVATVAVNATSFVDTTLAPETLYRFRLYAYNDAGKSGYSNTASATTAPNLPADPSAPVVTPPPAFEPPGIVLTLAAGQSVIVAAAP